MKFIKYDNFWWEWNDKESTLDYAEISRPDCSPYFINATLLELTEVKGWNDLNWYGMKLYDDKYDTGWLDRNGKFYGCDFECHEDQAQFVHNATEEELEEKGFIKITRDLVLNRLMAYFSGDSYDEKMQPTKAQIKYLSVIEKTKDCLIWFVYASDELDDSFEPNN